MKVVHQANLYYELLSHSEWNFHLRLFSCWATATAVSFYLTTATATASHIKPATASATANDGVRPGTTALQVQLQLMGFRQAQLQVQLHMMGFSQAQKQVPLQLLHILSQLQARMGVLGQAQL